MESYIKELQVCSVGVFFFPAIFYVFIYLFIYLFIFLFFYFFIFLIKRCVYSFPTELTA